MHQTLFYTKTEEDNGHIPEEIKDNVKVIKQDVLPFGDMKMTWKARELLFSVYQKRPETEVYPDHAEVLKKAGLAPEEFPTLDKIWEEDDKAHTAEKTSKKKHSERRSTFL
eukprot:430404-Ditylum_brightwellii.AAC.1